MFANIFKFFAAAALVSSALASPVPPSGPPSGPPPPGPGSVQSFNNWGGISSLNGFDNFFGSSDFSGSSFQETIVEQDTQLVCRSQSVSTIQQRLLVLQEMAKRIITEQICEVETQTIVFEQFHSSLGGFSKDLRRKSNRGVGYDRNIANHIGGLVSSPSSSPSSNDSGSLSSNDLGFSGSDLGKGYVVPTGNNWNNATSPAKVDSAWKASMNATKSSK